MCIGIPMQVLRSEESRALCSDGINQSWIDISLINPPNPGDWLLVFLGAAREIIDQERAHLTQQALLAIEAVMKGEVNGEVKGETGQLDHLFADLVDRQPELPSHLITHKTVVSENH